MTETGPQYPPGPQPGSNAIGSFQIGVSPIGTIQSFDVLKTIISQYANSPRLVALLQGFDDYVDPTANLDLFFDMIWNVDTAQGYGLDVWGRIVDVSRTLRMVELGEYFGFEEGEGFGFNQAPFFHGQPLTESYVLSDDAYRRMILCKAMANISDGSMKSINRILMAMFPRRGNAYVREGELGPWFGFQESTTGLGFGQGPFFIDTTQQFFFGFAEAGADALGFNQGPFYRDLGTRGMKFQYVFEFKLTPVEAAIARESGALPKPVGVTAQVVEVY